MGDLRTIPHSAHIAAHLRAGVPSFGKRLAAIIPVPLFQLHMSAGWFVMLALLFMAVVLLIIMYGRRRPPGEHTPQQESTDLTQQLMQSEMRALRSQMNPHFIFNAINSIQHYVLTNEKELANKYLVKFSRLMRNILELSKEEQISLKEELETARLYLEIEALRFNNAFTFTITCEEGIDQIALKLPPLLIQPFIENAIWHGLLLKEGAKCLSITVRKKDSAFEIAVDDNGIGREMAGKFRNEELRRRSFGMDITKERLEVLKKAHGMDISVQVTDKTEGGEAAGTRVIVNIKPSRKNL